MEINTQNKKMKLMQWFTTLVLVLILGGMVAAYIYYGMYAAQQAQMTTETEVATPDSDADDVRRQEIINALGNEAPVISEEKKNEIIESLTTQTSPKDDEMSEAKRQEIIQALQQN